MKRVLFVCTGNTCRSPLAEGMFSLTARTRGLAAEARSAGIAAVNGIPISKHTETILKEKGTQASAKGSQALTAEHVDWADLILTMTMGHKKSILQQYPAAVDKTYTLKEFAGSGDAETDAAVQQREKLMSELQIKMALNEAIAESEKERLIELERKLPDYDIVDPFGGSLASYRRCAGEIEAAVGRTIDKLLAD